MKSYIVLKCHHPESDLVVDLGDDADVDAYVRGVVFENGLYSMQLVYYSDLDIKEGEILIDDQPIADLEAASVQGERKEMRVVFKIQHDSRNRAYPFLMLMDAVHLRAEVTFEDDSTATLCSSRILVTTKSQEDQTNIDEMLSFLAAYDRHDSGIFSEADEASFALQTFQRFLHRALYALRLHGREYRDAYFSGNLRNLRGGGEGPLFWERRGAGFALGYRHGPATPTPLEAQEVFAFFAELLERSEAIYGEFCELIAKYTKEHELLQARVPSQYSAPVLATQMLRIRSANQEREMLRLLIHQLRVTLSGLVPLRAIRRQAVFPTRERRLYVHPIFFDLMTFGLSERVVSLKRHEFLFRIDSLSRLYEYYCLIRLLRWIEALGYGPDEREDESFRYPAQFAAFTSYSLIHNTFYRRKGRYVLTLYFCPVVYGDRVENGIDLIRTSGGDSHYSNYNKTGNYYTPDFLLQLRSQNATKCLILDAKFQSRHTILRGAMEESISKYFHQIRSISGEREQMVYLLQGRSDEYAQPLWSYENSTLFGARRVSDFGILRCMPDVDATESFAKLLGELERRVDRMQ